MNKEQDYILKTFLGLTSRTVPYGYESDFIHSMKKAGIFPEFIREDKNGNYFCQIGSSRTIFTAHIDTVGKCEDNIKHMIAGNIISTDGTTVLGADDKAGVTIMLYMIKNNIPGTYYFFMGEECGCVGSTMAAKSAEDFKGKYDRVISFDRRGTTSVITYQSFTRCCSDEFADALAKQLNDLGLSYKKDEGGVYTDSAEFTEIIPECTNLSVGYTSEHTVRETQDIEHLAKLAKACLSIEWEKLPTKRDMTKKEYRTYSYENSGVFYTSSYKNHNSNSYNSSGRYGNNYSRSSGYRVGQTRTYNDYDDWYGYEDDYDSAWRGISTQNKSDDTHSDTKEEWEVEYAKYKKTRRGNKKGKTYFDDGKDTFKVGDEIIFKSEKNYYNSVVDAIIDAKFTKEELEIVKDQYFDMDKKEDRELYEFLIKNIIV